MRLVDLRGHSSLFGHGPQEADPFPGQSDDDLVHVFPAGAQRALTLAEPPWGLPTAILDDFGVFFASSLAMPTDFGGVPRGPGPLDQRPTGMALPGLRHSPLPAPWPPRGCRGGQAQRGHAWSGVVEAGAVPPGGHRGDRDDARPAAPGLERCDHGR